MKYLPVAMTTRLARSGLLTQKHSPTILFAGGVVGAVASTVLACKATLKVEEALDQHVKHLDLVKQTHAAGIDTYSDQAFQRDRVVIYTRTTVTLCKLYAPAVGLGMISIAMLTGSHKILSGRNAALTAAYAGLERGFAEYRSRVVAEFGEDKERELRYGTENTEVVDSKSGKITKGPKVLPVAAGSSIYAKFFDEYNKNWSPNPEYNMLFLKCQQNYANDKLKARGHVFLNEVYDSLGLERTQAGAVVGWVLTRDGSTDNFIDFGIFDGDSEMARHFVNGHEASILLDFNVDGTIFDKI